MKKLAWIALQFTGSICRFHEQPDTDSAGNIRYDLISNAWRDEDRPIYSPDHNAYHFDYNSQPQGSSSKDKMDKITFLTQIESVLLCVGHASESHVGGEIYLDPLFNQDHMSYGNYLRHPADKNAGAQSHGYLHAYMTHASPLWHSKNQPSALNEIQYQNDHELMRHDSFSVPLDHHTNFQQATHQNMGETGLFDMPETDPFIRELNNPLDKDDELDGSSYHSTAAPANRSPDFPQSHPSPQGQVERNEFQAHVHSDPTQSYSHGSSSATLNHHITFSQASRQNKGEAELFNISEFPLIAFHVMAAIKFPLRAPLNEDCKLMNQQNLKIIRNSIEESFFEHQIQSAEPQFPEEISLLNRMVYYENNHVTSLRGFLIRLCLKNLAFLYSIQKRLDGSIELEMKMMLHWLHEALNPFDWSIIQESHGSIENPNVRNYIHSHVRQKVIEHLKREYSASSKASHMNIRKPLKRGMPQKVTEFEAQEARVILDILGNYYTSTNPDKWRRLFPKDHWFLKYCIKIVRGEMNDTRARDFERHWKDVKNSILPWSASIPEASITYKSYPKLFLNPLKVSGMIDARLDINGFEKKPWNDLLKYEKIHELD